jgi:hypothetical protein
MRTAMQTAEAIEPLDGQGQGGQQRHDEQTVGVVMAEMFEAVAISISNDFWPASNSERLLRCGRGNPDQQGSSSPVKGTARKGAA